MVAQVTKHHPSSVDLELVKRLAASTKCSTMLRFLCQEFSCIDKDLAGASAVFAAPQATATSATR